MFDTSPVQPAPPPPPSKGNGAFPNGTAFTPDQDIHVLDRLAILYKYRRIVVSVFILVLIMMMLGQYTAVPMYRAVAQIQIDEERTSLGERQDSGYVDSEIHMNTQLSILRGKELSRSVVKSLDLASVPEYNGQGPKPLGLRSAVTAVRDRITGQVAPAPRPPVTPPDESSLASALAERVSTDWMRDTRLVKVGLISTDPDFAVKAVNALVQEYTSQNLSSKLKATHDMLDWLNKELGRQAEKVKESDRAMATYRQTQDAISLDPGSNIVASRLTQLSEAVTRARTERLQKESVYNQVRALGPNNAGADGLVIIATDASVQARRTALNDLKRTKAAADEKYGTNHPTIVELKAKIADAEKNYDLEVGKTVTRIKNDYESALSNERGLQKALDEQKYTAQDLSKKGVEYQVLSQKASSDLQIYNQLLTRQKELEVQANISANNVKIIEAAEKASVFQPSSQRRWLLAILVALAVSVGLAFAMDYLNDTIKTPEDLTRRLKLPFLGLVPSVRGNAQPILSNQVPHDFGEAFRALRTSLVSTYAGESTRILLVTSAQPLEGKTTTAANTAIALAYGGARVLLIDADMRRPGVQRTLKIPNEKGLSHLLVGQSRFREVIQRTADPNLLVITAGRTPPNPSELLSSERMKSLLSNLAAGPFDWVIVDTPPVLAVTDAVILAPLVSGALFVVGAEMTRRRLAERAVETLMSGRPRVMGAVLNRVDFARNRYYYSRYYGYQHKSYYAEATV